jgi:hypothetical protein
MQELCSLRFSRIQINISNDNPDTPSAIKWSGQSLMTALSAQIMQLIPNFFYKSPL